MHASLRLYRDKKGGFASMLLSGLPAVGLAFSDSSRVNAAGFARKEERDATPLSSSFGWRGEKGVALYGDLNVSGILS